MVDVDTFISRDGVDRYKVKLYMEEYPNGRGPVLNGVNKEDKDGYTPLMYVIKYTDPENIALLLNKGGDVNHKNKKGESPMSVAIQRKSTVLVNFLLEEKNINEESKKMASKFLGEVKEIDEEISRLGAEVSRIEREIHRLKNEGLMWPAQPYVGRGGRRGRREPTPEEKKLLDEQRKILSEKLQQATARVQQLTEELKPIRETFNKLFEDRRPQILMDTQLAVNLPVARAQRIRKNPLQNQSGSKRKTQKRKRVRPSKKTRGRR